MWGGEGAEGESMREMDRPNTLSPLLSIPRTCNHVIEENKKGKIKWKRLGRGKEGFGIRIIELRNAEAEAESDWNQRCINQAQIWRHVMLALLAQPLIWTEDASGAFRCSVIMIPISNHFESIQTGKCRVGNGGGGRGDVKDCWWNDHLFSPR